MTTIRDLVDLAPRATGTPGGEAAADYVAERMSRAGLSTEVLEAPSFRWEARECRLETDGVAIPCAPVLHSGLGDHQQIGDVDHDVRARIVDIGTDRVRRHDVRGAVVLFDLTFDMTLAHSLPLARYIHDPGRRMLRRDVLGSRNPYVTSLARTMTEAAAAGAVALIGVLRDYPDSARYHNEYYRRTLFSLPGVWITRAEGLRLRDLLSSRGGPSSCVRRRRAGTPCAARVRAARAAVRSGGAPIRRPPARRRRPCGSSRVASPAPHHRPRGSSRRRGRGMKPSRPPGRRSASSITSRKSRATGTSCDRSMRSIVSASS